MAKTELPEISLIIPSRERPALLLDTVRSILAGDTAPSELIVVDQSRAPNRELERLAADRPGEFRYLWRPAPGVSRARNIGIAAARHDLLVFTDDDVLVEPDWLGSLARALVAAGPRAVVTGRVLPAAGPGGPGFVPSVKVDQTPAVYAGRAAEDVLYSNNMAMRRASIERIGGFDERLGPGTRFPAAEDNDVCFRLLEAGERVIYVPEAALHHRAWRAEAEFLPLRWSYGRGQGAYYAKHFGLRDRYMLGRFAAHAARYLRRCGRSLLGQRRRAYGDAVYVLGLLYGAGAWLLERAARREVWRGTTPPRKSL